MAHTRHLIGRLADSGLAKMGSEPREAVSKRRKKKPSKLEQDIGVTEEDEQYNY